MSRASDDALIAEFQAGRARAFDELLSRYQSPLMGYLVRMTRSREVAEDVFQETFLRVVRALPRYEKRGQFKSWLYRMASNLCIDHFRKEGRRPTVSLDADGEGEGSGSLMGTLSDGGAPPDREARERQLLEALERAIERLPEAHREVYLLRTVSGLSFKEIAETMRCPLGTALGRMHDALGKLRADLGEEWLLELTE